MVIPIRRRSVGANIALVFSLLFGNLGRLLIVSLLFSLPMIGLQIVASLDPERWTSLNENGVLRNDARGFSFLIFMLLLPFLIASVLGIITGSYTGEKVTVGKSLGLAARKFLPLMLYGILLSVLLFASMMVPSIVLAMSSGPGAIHVIIVVGAFFFFYLILCTFSVGMPAIIAEDLGVLGGLGRSLFLTSGHRLGIFGFMFLLGLVSLALFMAIMVPLGVIGTLLEAQIGDGEGSHVVLQALSWLMIVVISLLFVIAPVVIYFQLRAAKEKFQIASLAELVDRIQVRRTSDRSHPEGS